MYPLYVLVPLLLGGVVALLLGARTPLSKYSKYAALTGTLASSAIALILLLHPSAQFSIAWFSFQQYSFPLSFAMQPLNDMLLAIVAIISPLVFLYSAGYMDVASEQGRYYLEMSLFAASMTLLALSNGFLTLFIAWIGLGITSYLLIGFWHRKSAPPRAARKAITTILIGDVAMLAGMLLLYGYFSSFNFTTINTAAATVAPALLLLPLGLVLVAAFTKSAQFPFHEWLSDAMEGPTPVSAYLHSSTMVKSGIFVVALLFPLFIAAHMLLPMLVIGLVTTAIGALNALSSTHIKKILAYSTVEDLGLMFVALGLNALPAALFLFVVQAFYKALLFMSVGSVMKANGDEVDIYKVTAYGRNRILFAVTMIGALSIAGIFPLSGFFGKASIDQAALSNSVVYIILTAADFLTAFYIFRWLFIPMTNQKKTQKAASYVTQKKSMLLPQLILAGLVIGATAYVLVYSQPLKLSISVIAIETIVAAAGLATAYMLFSNPAFSFWKNSRAREFLSKGFYVNQFYLYLASFVALVAQAIEIFDNWLNRLFYVSGRSVADAGGALSYVERGNVNVYIAASAAGLILVILMLVFIA